MSDNLKLQLENFQSISRGELIFEKGLNFIIGQSNSGKSATFRALKACLTNPSGSQRFIKKDTKRAVVTLTYEGNEITWKRTPSESSYSINNEDYIKTGRSSAMKILENQTGFVQGNGDTLMNIEEELQLPFPFGMSEFELFKLFENIFCVSDSATILKSAKDYEDKAKTDIVTIESEINKSKRKLSAIEEFKGEVDFNKLSKYKEFLVNKKERLFILHDGQDIIRKAVLLDKENFDVLDITIEDKIYTLNNLNSIKGIIKKVKSLHSLGNKIKEIKSIEGIDLTNYKELRNIKKSLDILVKLKELKLPEVSFSNKVDKYIDLEATRKTIEQVKELNSITLPKMEFSSLMDTYKALLEYKSYIVSLSARLDVTKQDLKKANEKLADIENRLKEFKVCPLCHKPLDE